MKATARTPKENQLLQQAEEINKEALKHLGSPEQTQEQFLRQIAASHILKGEYQEAQQTISSISLLSKPLPSLEECLQYSEQSTQK